MGLASAGELAADLGAAAIKLRRRTFKAGFPLLAESGRPPSIGARSHARLSGTCTVCAW